MATLASPFFFDQPNDVFFQFGKVYIGKNLLKNRQTDPGPLRHQSFAVHITLPETNITPETLVGFGVGRGFLPGAMFVLGSVMF